MALKANRKQSLGRWGERLAADHLHSLGYTLLGQNVRTPHGELDLIALQPANATNPTPTLVFVEVRTRASTVLGAPELSVTPTKQDHIRKSAAYYLQTHPDQAAAVDWRVDVIAIRRLDPHSPPEITHFENAFA